MTRTSQSTESCDIWYINVTKDSVLSTITANTLYTPAKIFGSWSVVINIGVQSAMTMWDMKHINWGQKQRNYWYFSQLTCLLFIDPVTAVRYPSITLVLFPSPDLSTGGPGPVSPRHSSGSDDWVTGTRIRSPSSHMLCWTLIGQ